jgi:hypothetical protein
MACNISNSPLQTKGPTDPAKSLSNVENCTPAKLKGSPPPTQSPPPTEANKSTAGQPFFGNTSQWITESVKPENSPGDRSSQKIRAYFDSIARSYQEGPPVIITNDPKSPGKTLDEKAHDLVERRERRSKAMEIINRIR